MNKKNALIISYISGWVYEEDGGMKIKVPAGNEEAVVLDNTKRFHNCLYLLAGLSPCARNLMDWLTEEMNNDNMVYHTAGSRRSFNDFLNEITNKKVNYADQTVKQAWQELNRAGLLIARATKATFMVHPKFFFKGSDKARIEKVIAQITFDNKGSDNFKVYYDKKTNKILEK